MLPPALAEAKQGPVLFLGWISKQKEATGHRDEHWVVAKGEKELKHLLGAAGNSAPSCSPSINPTKSKEAGQDLCPKWGKPAWIKTEPQKSRLISNTKEPKLSPSGMRSYLRNNCCNFPANPAAEPCQAQAGMAPASS